MTTRSEVGEVLWAWVTPGPEGGIQSLQHLGKENYAVCKDTEAETMWPLGYEEDV